MEPLSKEEIQDIEILVAGMYGGGMKPGWFWPRLFYTARLGAEFVKQTQKSLDTETKQV